MFNERFDINMEYYKVFYYVVRFGSITAAAEKMSATQPGVSKTVRRLEEQLGCQLFLRSKRGVTLTREGEMLWARLEPACQMILAAENELHAALEMESGVLSVASTEMGLATYVLPALRRFLARYPKVRVLCRNALTGQIVDMLRDSRAELAILYSPFAPGKDMQAQVIDIYREVLVAGPRFAALADRRHSLAELRDFPFISMPESTSCKDYLSDFFRANGLSFEPNLEVTTMDLALQAARQDFGLCILPEPVARREAEKGGLFFVQSAETLPERRVLAVTQDRYPLSPAARIFLREHLLPSGSGRLTTDRL